MGDNDLYGKTTESLESVHLITCGSKFKACGGGGKREKKSSTDAELRAVHSVNDEEVYIDVEPPPEQREARRKSRFKDVSHTIMNLNLFTEDADEEKMNRRNQRRIQHLRKFGGHKYDIAPITTSTGKKQEHAAKLLFDACKEKMNRRPRYDLPTWQTYGGRSFLPADVAEGDVDIDAVDAVDGGPSKPPYRTAQARYDFFGFHDEYDIRDKTVKERELSKKKKPVAAVGPGGPTNSGGSRVVPGGPGKTLDRFNISARKQKKKQPSLYSRILGKTFKRGVLDSVKDQTVSHRSFFTWWLCFVQTVVMIVVLATYPFAPIGKDVRNVRRNVLLSRDGVLRYEFLDRDIVESFWLGPHLESLIKLGAKYAPCMRRDKRVFNEIGSERLVENSTGCCIQTTMNGCIQRGREECLSSSTKFNPKTVCGLHPKNCLISSIPSSKWDPESIIAWPKCTTRQNFSRIKEYPQLTCEITGRPCCIGTQGQCVITSKDNCDFWDGIYNPDANLCSQVDCLAETCGNSFSHDDNPDQIYRLLVPLFLNAGILHLLLTLIFNITIMRDVEGNIGWFRTAMIFFISGAGGYLWSSVLIPYEPEVGESGAMFGIFSCIVVEGLQSWKIIEQPCRYISILLLILLVMFLFGLLPYIDNFAHIFGFLYGFFLAYAIVPPIIIGKTDEEKRKEKRNNIIISVVSIIIVVALSILGFVLFYETQQVHSKAIAYFNCPPILGEKFCRNFHQGQSLEPRGIQY